MIELRGVHKAFAGRPVLVDLDLRCDRGEVLFIIGTSGVGKSVTIKHLVGLLRVDAGEIWLDGRRIDALPERAFHAIRRRVAMVFQGATLFDSMTLAENVALPLRKHGRMRAAAALADARRRLDEVGLADFVDRYPAELSDGMRKRGAIARALTLDPEVVLFDEPTTGLDPINARRVDRLIRELADRRGVTAIVVSHDLASIFAIADRIAFLYQGGVRACGTPAEIRGSDDPVVQQFIQGRASGPMETPGF
ncbi:MAG: ATP-binding cassette domain-containing protein [Kofleriaceae bacterium]|nr:ATP-binding cassette domain-containing protein [Myxococcales bacterium]MCB9561290.1 ATP-binding cassette domain-containing protein [Kofleriaceae bacterium]